MVAPGGPSDGLAVFRLRRRGGAREATLCELLAPEPAARRDLLAAGGGRDGADYVIAAGTAVRAPRPMVALPGQGPILTWRGVAPERRRRPRWPTGS